MSPGAREVRWLEAWTPSGRSTFEGGPDGHEKTARTWWSKPCKMAVTGAQDAGFVSSCMGGVRARQEVDDGCVLMSHTEVMDWLFSHD